MSAKFTPGPWHAKFVNNADDTSRIMWRECGQGWVRERRLDRDCAGGFSPENARLIAAAPELLSILSRIYDAHTFNPYLWNEAADVLAKATGERSCDRPNGDGPYGMAWLAEGFAPASAIETGTAETAGLGPKDESAPGRPESGVQ